MATATKPETDIIRRGVKRTLPCKLTQDEFLLIARQRVDKETLRDQLEEDFARIKAKHKAAVEELDDEILKARRELHSGEQDRTVLCSEEFERSADGTGWVVTVRVDTVEVVERRPASPTETQRYLPGVDGTATAGGSLLERAAAAQGSSPTDEDEDEDEDEDDGLTEPAPKRRRGKAKGKS
jgi:hypothetical protein